MNLPTPSGGFPILAASHIVVSGGFLFVSRLAIAAVLTGVALGNEIAMRPAVTTEITAVASWFILLIF